MKVNLEYVISACGMMGVFTNHIYDNHRDLLKKTLLGLMSEVNKGIENDCHNSNASIATLFNAYTEASFVERFKALDNLGAKALYADSGGLQMVTAGRAVTDEIKQQIYKTQTHSDYAMCFDVIPLESISTTRTRNERSNVSNKIFNQSKHIESGYLTGKNIKEQVNTFKSLNAKTKVIMIIQGNNHNDMIDYYNQIANQLTEDDYENISGMAMADTCIGNGTLESIEMLRGARQISKICHPNVKKHLHILGVGSISRMRPILYLTKSGYLNTFEKISYDSSSHTSCYDYGLLKVNGTCRALGSTRTHKAEVHFRNVYKLFRGHIGNMLTEDEYVDMILGDGSRDWKYSTVKDLANNLPDEKMIVAYLVKVMHTYYQVENFVKNLDKVLDSNDESDIGRLLQVKSDSDMLTWQTHISKHVKSKRIKRKENVGSLEGII